MYNSKRFSYIYISRKTLRVARQSRLQSQGRRSVTVRPADPPHITSHNFSTSQVSTQWQAVICVLVDNSLKAIVVAYADILYSILLHGKQACPPPPISAAAGPFSSRCPPPVGTRRTPASAWVLQLTRSFCRILKKCSKFANGIVIWLLRGRISLEQIFSARIIDVLPILKHRRTIF